ncbi:5-methyltetrahydropteroyltriglutamate--homocysteine S-methyltransferase [Candidatus Vidania fulgoroideorum]
MNIKNHIIGLPIIGKKRELKFSIENFIKRNSLYYLKEIIITNKKIILKNIKNQIKLDFITIGFHSFYDKMIYMKINLGIIPNRFNYLKKINLTSIINITNGKLKTKPLRMTKWFGTNYHYFIPEIGNKSFKKKISRPIIYEEIFNIKKNNKKKIKVSIIGPFTFIYLSYIEKKKKKKIIKRILRRYLIIIKKILKIKNFYIQLEENIFYYKIDKKWYFYMGKFYNKLNKNKIFFVTYNCILNNKIINFINKINFLYFHIDAYLNKNKFHLLKKIKTSIISLGIINSSNIWINNFKKSINFINKINKNLLIGTNGSMLMCPYSSEYEKKSNIFNFLSFSIQKIKELIIIKKIFKNGSKKLYIDNLKKNFNLKKIKFNQNKYHSFLKKIKNIKKIRVKKKQIGLGQLPLTTIGSFPQTKSIRKIRLNYKKKKINNEKYFFLLNKFIKKNIKLQIKYSVNAIVNGEVEREDMVEYFCKNYSGFYITKNGWVQSYGTRCLKPAIMYGKAKRIRSNIFPWYNDLNNKYIIKGIITGPITFSKWSFLREDIKKRDIIYNISFCLKKEVEDLYKAGVKIIQIDEPAVKESMPESKKEIKKYLNILKKSFKITCFPVINKKVQIHTHFCYSKLENRDVEIFKKICVDVITIESSKNLDENINFIKKNPIFKKIEIGLGLYDVHSRNVPSVKFLTKQIRKIIKNIKFENIWLNPDCGLKTRNYDQVTRFLKNIILSKNSLLNKVGNLIK